MGQAVTRGHPNAPVSRRTLVPIAYAHAFAVHLLEWPGRTSARFSSCWVNRSLATTAFRYPLSDHQHRLRHHHAH